jgi:hypothetical protein
MDCEQVSEILWMVWYEGDESISMNWMTGGWIDGLLMNEWINSN